MKNKYVAAGLALVLGAVGAHKFYLEKQGQGVFYFMLMIIGVNIFNFPISALFGFVDALGLMFMSNDRFDQLYNKGKTQGATRGNARRQNTQSKRRKKVSRFKKNPFKTSGEKKYAEYDVDGAIEDLQQALDIHPHSKDIHFLLAKAYSLSEQKEKSFYHLQQAILYGYEDLDKVMSEDDLAYIRIQPEFEQFKASGYQRIPTEIKTQTIEAEQSQPRGMLLNQLNKLAELRNKGLLSEKEFLKEKEKLMRQ